ncbi:MAG: hypothetical protein PVF45_01700 [Anaerolineae bacterium]
MTISNTPLAGALGASRPALRVNPAVVVGVGDFGGVALRRLTSRLRRTHLALVESMGWLRLTTSGWQEPSSAELTTAGPYNAAPVYAPLTIAPAPLAQALDAATSQATVGALNEAGYDVSASLDTLIIAHADEVLAREALWLLLDLLRAQPPLRKNRVTLVLACDSRRFAGPSAPALAGFFDQLAARLVAGRAAPRSGAVAWCYLCDVLDVDSRLLGNQDAVQSQVELVEGFVALLIGSGLRRDRAYARTALPQLAHDVGAPPDAALVSSFSLGACVLPVEQIAALAHDRLALRLHGAAFPPKASVTDRETGWSARERLLASVDLSPQSLRARLLRGPDDAPLRFDTTPPDLSGMDEETTLRGLARWRNDLQTRWAEESTSPPAQIARNAGALLDELSGQVRREVDGLVKNSPRGLYQALAFLDELPQAIREAQIQLTADDGGFLEMMIPSVDQSFQKLGDHVTKKQWRWWESLILASVVYFPLMILFLLNQVDWWYGWLVVWSVNVISAWIFGPRRYRGRLAKLQTDFIAAVRLKFKSAREREMRTRRRGILDGLSQAVRQERVALLDWQRTIAEARMALASATVPPFQSTGGERPLCDPADYPSPVEGYDEEKIAELAHYLDPATRPYRRQDEARAIVAWLQQGAERALAGWRETLNVAAWTGAEPAQVIDDLVSSVRPQWPLAPRERRQVELNVVGLLEKDARVLPERDDLGRVVVVSTYDPLRLTYAPTRHGLRLKKLAATRPLWEAQRDTPPPHMAGARDTILKTFAWRYAPTGEAQEQRLTLTLSRSRYQALRSQPRPPRGQWGRLVAAPAPELDTLAEDLSALHHQQGWSALERAADVLAFTQQCITYDSDQRSALSSEWPRYPLETLVEGVGDCEDAVILAASLLKRLGYDVALLYYPGHCALGVAGAEDLPGDYVEDAQTGVRYFFGETTSEGWSLGQVPEKYREMATEEIEVVRTEE